MTIKRASQNPLIKPEDIKPSTDDFEVIGVFNPAATRANNEVVLLLRVAEKPIAKNPNIASAAIYDVAEDKVILKDFSKDDGQYDFSDPRLITSTSETYLTSMSHFRLAHSSDGINFVIDEVPTIMPKTEYETFGIEDARITLIDGIYYINYVGASPAGVVTSLISTKDFLSFKRLGVIFCPDNKDVVIFPGKIGGKYYAMHRPASGLFKKNDIWLAESPDLLNWGNHRQLMGPARSGWDNIRIGAGAVPIRTDAGWLEIYHGADQDNRYCLGAVLLDAEKPWKILAKSEEPIFEPEEKYECDGFFGNVVFTCGLLCEQDKLKIYYGSADTTICYVEIDLVDVLNNLAI